MTIQKTKTDESFRNLVIADVLKFAEEKNSFELLEKKYAALPKETLVEELIQVGIMPEVFEHDSSEEKLWSKFSDIILCKSLEYLGLKSEVLRTRGNSADVYSRGEGYSLVSDAKCFRLSRTAKNQKDFKVKSLDDWRRQDTYALLVAPLSQYPSNRSQIYSQAVSQNVVLFSYLHLQFLIEKGVTGDLNWLWKFPKSLLEKYQSDQHKNGVIYWREMDSVVCKISDQTEEALISYKQKESQKTKAVGLEGIDYWQNRISEIWNLTRDEAIKRLIKAQKIEQKIETIKQAIGNQ